MENTLDLSQAAEYDLIVAKDRTLNTSITCTYVDITGTTQFFQFSGYTGATLTVKNTAGTILLTFNTVDGSILLQNNGVFKLVKNNIEMNKPNAGQYNYDMYLSNAIYPKRAFLRGKITFIQNIAN